MAPHPTDVLEPPAAETASPLDPPLTPAHHRLLDPTDTFVRRHLGSSDHEIAEMPPPLRLQAADPERAGSVSRAVALSGKGGLVSHGDDPQVVIGFDTRFMSDRYATEVARVMAGNGVVAWLTRADAPFISASTSFIVAIVVSPGVVIASAPCAAP